MFGSGHGSAKLTGTYRSLRNDGRYLTQRIDPYCLTVQLLPTLPLGVASGAQGRDPYFAARRSSGSSGPYSREMAIYCHNNQVTPRCCSHACWAPAVSARSASTSCTGSP